MDVVGIFGPVKSQNKYVNSNTKACHLTVFLFPEKVAMV